MGRSCCVPGCRSNYGTAWDTSTFKFPKDKTLKEKWIRNIHRDNFQVTNKTVVCIKHFDPKFVLREDVFPVLDGEPIRVPRKYPKLSNDAYPTIFPNQPAYHTVSLPKSRTNPSERLEQSLKRDDESFSNWCEQDSILNFDLFKTEVQKRCVEPFTIAEKEDYILFVKLEDSSFSDVPAVSVSFKISHSLEVQAFYKDLCLPTEKFEWLGCNYKCDKWSKFDNLLSHLANYSEANIEVKDRVLILTQFLKQGFVNSDANKGEYAKIKFAIEQLELAVTNQIRYSPELLIWAATLSYSFPGAYQALRKTDVLTLPHHVYLRQFLTEIGPNSPGIGPSQKAFLREKTKNLQENDKVVTVMLDEIYVNSKVSYKAGKILGMAENKTENETAATMQVFMASSMRSENKDVLGLFPVKGMNSETLLQLTVEILKLMEELGFEVICLVCDNHSTNRKMYELLGGGTLKPCVLNPANTTKSLFLLFDTVHLLKCIRNNWLNRSNFIIPNVDQTFSLVNNMLSVSEGSAVLEFTTVEAKFSDLRNLFHSEKNMLLKLAPKLSRKALYPSSIERQNVSLAICIFDFKTIEALKLLKSQGVDVADGTIQFLELILKWWSICNVQHPMKGKYTRNEDTNPISGMDDPKLLFLEGLKTFTDIWQMSDSAGKLSTETYTAFSHTLTALVQLCKYVFSTYNWQYILTAKLQTDGLEGRFGAYRRLSGCTYNVSVEQILESERKLKVLSVLKLKSAKLGEFTLKDFALQVKETSRREKIVENLDLFESALEELSDVLIPLDTKKILVCIASYTSMKVLENLQKTKNQNCEECLQMLQCEEELLLNCDEALLAYFKQLNRGGLKYPSSVMISICCEVFRLFQVLISSNYEPAFLQLENQKDAVVTLGIEVIRSNVENMNEVCKCGTSLIAVVKKCVKVLANIFINNYTNVLNEKNMSKDIAKKLKRQSSAVNVGEKVTKRKELKLSSK